MTLTNHRPRNKAQAYCREMMQAILPKVSVKLQVHQQTKSQQMPHRHLQQANEIDVGA